MGSDSLKYNMPIKILNLIIYNGGQPHLETMRNHVSTYLKNFVNSDEIYLQHYFISFREQEEEIMFEDDIMWLKGVESRVPGILDKTLKAIRYWLEKDGTFDLIVRSNSSTAINFKKFPYKEIATGYAAPHCLTMYWLDPEANITDHRYDGVVFASGTCIVLTKETAKLLISVPVEPIIDDVAIGAMLFGRVQLQKLSTPLLSDSNQLGGVFYRHNSSSETRMADADAMGHTYAGFQ